MSQITALLLSLVIEGAVAATAAGMARWGDPRRAAIAAIIGTLLTHGLTWWSVAALEAPLGYLPAVLAVETAVVAAESIAYRLIMPLRLLRALALSLLANAASASAGLALYGLAVLG